MTTVKKFAWREGVAVGALLSLFGCSSPAFQAAEADVHAAFVATDALVVEGTADPETLHKKLAAIVALDPTNKTLLSLQVKGDAAIDAGDLTTLHVFTAGGAAVTAPPSPALVPAKQ